MDAKALYKAGKLAEAIAAMNEEVRKHPLDTSGRGFLAELLCIAGNFERADKLLEALALQDAAAGPSIAMFRQIVRADQARHQLWSDGRVPEVLGEPTPTMRLCLSAVVATREGRHADALKFVAEAEEARPKPHGTCDGAAFDDLRDLDDVTSGFFEVLTSTGKFFWIPIERVELVEFRPPERPRDLLWRRAHMIVRDGPDGEVFVPAIYGGIADADESARLGRTTDWRGGETSPVRGVGQRTLLVGSEARPMLEIGTISIEA